MNIPLQALHRRAIRESPLQHAIQTFNGYK